jgi:hypothetical protein
MTCVLVAVPMIDAKTPRIEAECLRRLQEGAVGIAGVDPELDYHARLQRTDQPHGEGYVRQPGGRLDEACRIF